jgi:hypothetical protein
MRSPPRGAELLVLPAATVAQIGIENLISLVQPHNTQHNNNTHNTQQQQPTQFLNKKDDTDTDTTPTPTHHSPFLNKALRLSV